MAVVCTALRMRGYVFGQVVEDPLKAERLLLAHPRQFMRVPEDATTATETTDDDGAPASLPKAAAEKE